MEFSFFLIARKAAPALLTGNIIVVKPSQLTPENAYVFAQIVDEVGLPKGVFNLVNGRGSVIGHELAANPKVGMVVRPEVWRLEYKPWQPLLPM